jgi:hypothetical protein
VTVEVPPSELLDPIADPRILAPINRLLPSQFQDFADALPHGENTSSQIGAYPRRRVPIGSVPAIGIAQ